MCVCVCECMCPTVIHIKTNSTVLFVRSIVLLFISVLAVDDMLCWVPVEWVTPNKNICCTLQVDNHKHSGFIAMVLFMHLPLFKAFQTELSPHLPLASQWGQRSEMSQSALHTWPVNLHKHTLSHTCIRGLSTHFHTHACTHTLSHTSIHFHMHARKHISTHAHTSTHFHMHTHKHTLSNACMHARKSKLLSHTHAQTHKYTLAHTCMHTHTFTRMHVCTHTHTSFLELFDKVFNRQGFV